MDEGPLASRFRRRLTITLFVIYSAFVALVTLSPELPGDGFIKRNVQRALDALHKRGLFEFVEMAEVEFMANVLMFIPLGIFVALLISRRHWWLLFFMGTAISGVIELAQMLFLSERTPDVRDLVSNTIGFLIGAVGAVIFRLLVAHRDGLVERDRQAGH